MKDKYHKGLKYKGINMIRAKRYCMNIIIMSRILSGI
jgi:hypothetical protein